MRLRILWPEQSRPLSAREGSGLSSRSRSIITDLLTLAGEENIGQWAAKYLKQGLRDHSNNARHSGLDWIFANKGCFWHRFASFQSKTISRVYHETEGCVFVNQDRQWQEHATNLGRLCCSPAMTVTLTDTRSHVIVTLTRHSVVSGSTISDTNSQPALLAGLIRKNA